jgi:hypothetical protein
VQDMPPVGGFPSIRIQRRLPSTGPTGVAIFAVGAAVMAYGYYNVSWCWAAAAACRTLELQHSTATKQPARRAARALQRTGAATRHATAWAGRYASLIMEVEDVQHATRQKFCACVALLRKCSDSSGGIAVAQQHHVLPIEV